MLDKNNAIEVRNVHKKFRIYYDKGRMLKERAINWKRNRYEERWVLKGISFEVKKGEAVGLIGHNGCGKSTTLKLLTEIIYPDSGSVELAGRVSSLLELGAGFHPDLSGRENIYINASIFGLTKKEIDRRIQSIIDFSELEEFIDNPVRTYSSGMYMRLAFSVAINVDADILLIDEILAVGDVNFQAKCFNKLLEIKNSGTTIVLVSHSTAQIERICNKSIWIHDGLIRMEGEPVDVHREYLMYMGDVRSVAVEEELAKANEQKKQELLQQQEEEDAKVNDTSGEEEEKPVEGVMDPDEETENEKPVFRVGSGEARFGDIRSRDKDNNEKYVFKMGEQIRFDLEYTVSREVKNVAFGLSIIRVDGTRCYGTNTKVDGLPLFDLKENGKITMVFDNVKLLPAKYHLDICIEKKQDDFADYWAHVNEFEIVSHEQDIGVIRMDHNWEY